MCRAPHLPYGRVSRALRRGNDNRPATPQPRPRAGLARRTPAVHQWIVHPASTWALSACRAADNGGADGIEWTGRRSIQGRAHGKLEPKADSDAVGLDMAPCPKA